MRVSQIEFWDISHSIPTLVEGFILDKTIAVNSPKRMENVKILIANTCEYLWCTLNVMFNESGHSAMDTDKIKIFGARVKVDGTGKLAELERAERVRQHPSL
jgi:T-complex protein 1 subunit beta